MFADNMYIPDLMLGTILYIIWILLLSHNRRIHMSLMARWLSVPSLVSRCLLASRFWPAILASFVKYRYLFFLNISEGVRGHVAWPGLVLIPFEPSNTCRAPSWLRETLAGEPDNYLQLVILPKCVYICQIKCLKSEVWSHRQELGTAVLDV